MDKIPSPYGRNIDDEENDDEEDEDEEKHKKLIKSFVSTYLKTRQSDILQKNFGQIQMNELSAFASGMGTGIAMASMCEGETLDIIKIGKLTLKILKEYAEKGEL
jgi:hypothetical protein